MITYIMRRLVLMIPSLLIVSMIVFFTIRLIPGGILDQMVAQQGATSQAGMEAQKAYLEHRLGLDVPIHIQFGRWLKGLVLHGDLGTSLWMDTSVASEISPRIPVSLELGIIGLVVALLISFPIGVFSAIRQDTTGDYLARSFAILCIAVPVFWLGTMVVVFPSVWWGWSSLTIYVPFSRDPIENMAQFILPGIILGMSFAGTTMRMIRTMMLEVLRQDYIRTAWSKGLKEQVVIVRHALKNTLIPVVTLIGLYVPNLIAGAVILEQIFLLPGIGRLLVDNTINRDYPIISGVVLLIAVLILFTNLAVDIVYANLDPRIRYQ